MPNIPAQINKTQYSLISDTFGRIFNPTNHTIWLDVQSSVPTKQNRIGDIALLPGSDLGFSPSGGDKLYGVLSSSEVHDTIDVPFVVPG